MPLSRLAENVPFSEWRIIHPEQRDQRSQADS